MKNIIYAIIVALIIASAFASGYYYSNQAHLKAQIKLQNQLKEKQAKIDTQAIELSEALADIKIEYVVKNQEVIRYEKSAPTIECFNDDAVRLFNATSSHTMPKTP